MTWQAFARRGSGGRGGWRRQPMPTVVDAQARVEEFEREHGFSVRDSYTASVELHKRRRWKQRLTPMPDEGAHR